MGEIEDFFEHYGVKGMTWSRTQQATLDRIYRVEAGTSARRERVRKARKKLAKDVIEETPDLNRQNGSDSNKQSLEDFLKKVGDVKFADIVSQDQ